MSGSLQPLVGYGASSYKIANSLRFRSSASAYLSRTFSSPTSQYVWTFSAWVKRGVLGSSSYQALMATRDTGSAGIWWWGDTLTIANNGAGALVAQSTAVFRDPSAWYHVVVKSNGTTIVGYVNNQQVLSYTGTIGRFNTAVVHNIANDTQSSYYFDGYMADINFIDGQALDPTSFGAFDTTTGVWTPKSYAGTYGTNGFHLNFSNGTSTTTLGYDSSGNSNNWTTNNISLTAGSTYDWMIDSPTPYQGSSYGVGNYAVLNPLSGVVAGIASALSNGNLNITGASGGDSWRPSTIAISSGKWYFETTVTTVGAISMVGINNVTLQPAAADYAGTSSLGYVYMSTGNKRNNNVTVSYGTTYTSGDIIGCAFDADAGSLTFYVNGVSQGVAYSSIPAGSYCFNVYGRNSGGANDCAANFGQRPFAYTPPSGYKSLCTYNLPTPTIQNGANYMAATTYTGTGATLAVSNAVNGVGFQPDFIWIKSRSAAYSHRLQNSVAGFQGLLTSDSTGAEYTASSGDYPTVSSSGFSLPYGTNGLYYNGSGVTFVGWQWKAGGAAVANNAGSIASQVSANTTAGFSVVTYTGTGANATVGHGLGVAPSFIIQKVRNGAGYYWDVWHSAFNGSQVIFLNATDAVATNSAKWNGTVPAATVFSVGTDSGTNGSGNTNVAYCFAAIPGYSAFGSYTGNGSADGPFVYCGFRPRYLMVKRTDSTGAWEIYDTSRSPYNATGAKDLQADSAAAEGASGISIGYDILSNGFKNRDTTSYLNTSGGTYIYAAFAENPITNSLAR